MSHLGIGRNGDSVDGMELVKQPLKSSHKLENILRDSEGNVLCGVAHMDMKTGRVIGDESASPFIFQFVQSAQDFVQLLTPVVQEKMELT